MPRVLKCVDYIKFPDHFEFEEMGCNAAIDGSVHRRCRVFPNQHAYYSGSYRFHCLHVLATCGLDGNIYDIVISPGSNTDQSVFRSSQTDTLFLQNGVTAFADRGFGRNDTLRVPIPNPSLIRQIGRASCRERV